jgi:hypothetical protein
MMSDRDKAWEKINDTRTEFAKLHYDWLKHLTTLCTGSLLVISALSGSVFADFYLLRWLIPVTLVLLLLALLLLVFSMWYYLNWSERTSVFWYLQADEGHEVYEDLSKIEEVATQSDLIVPDSCIGRLHLFRLGRGELLHLRPSQRWRALLDSDSWADWSGKQSSPWVPENLLSDLKPHRRTCAGFGKAILPFPMRAGCEVGIGSRNRAAEEREHLVGMISNSHGGRLGDNGAER